MYSLSVCLCVCVFSDLLYFTINVVIRKTTFTSVLYGLTLLGWRRWRARCRSLYMRNHFVAQLCIQSEGLTEGFSG